MIYDVSYPLFKILLPPIILQKYSGSDKMAKLVADEFFDQGDMEKLRLNQQPIVSTHKKTPLDIPIPSFPQNLRCLGYFIFFSTKFLLTPCLQCSLVVVTQSWYYTYNV